MKFHSELNLLKKAAGCAVIFLGLAGAMPVLAVTAHADSSDDGYSSDDGAWIDDSANSPDFWDDGSDGGLGGEGEGDGGVASLGDSDDQCGESVEESQC